MILGYDKTPSLMSLSLCNSRGINSTMASADSNFDDLSVFLCAVYSLLIIKMLNKMHSLFVNYRDLPVLVH